ncbi:hypothetical protein ACFL2A_00740 [Thermodesulfobacteriota bacterium]
MKIKIIVIFVLLIVGVSSSALCKGGGLKKYPKYVSIINLIATPEKYDGAKVNVTGYALLTDEETMGIYLTESCAKHFIFKNAISLDDSYKNAETVFFMGSPKTPKLFSKYMTIKGTFKMSKKYNNNSEVFSGHIVDIEHITYLPDVSLIPPFKETFTKPSK